jgi:IS30 family transposase
MAYPGKAHIQVQDAMEKMNNRQREIIGYQTPDQLFFSI